MTTTSPGSVLATVARVQVQRSYLKPRPSGSGHYDPAPLLEVDSLEVDERGCVGLTGGQRVVDLHHADHPDTRNKRLYNSVSFLPRAHYERMRARYGPHVVDGSAGENVLLDTDGPLTVEDLTGRLWLELSGQPVEVTAPRAAAPCVEFTRWVLGRDDLELDQEVRTALDDLDGGVRGFYLQPSGAGVLRPGARLWRA